MLVFLEILETVGVKRQVVWDVAKLWEFGLVCYSIFIMR